MDRHHEHALHSPCWWVRCIFGAPENGWRIPRWYERALVWDIEHHPTPLGRVERVLNPLLGKSVVLYFDKPAVDFDQRVGGEGRASAASGGG